MDQSKWVKMSLFVILVLLFTAVTGQSSPSFIVRVGDEVTLPCENVIKNQDKCDSTSWVASRYSRASGNELVNHGQIKSGLSGDKSGRLSMTANCSLVIKNVTDDDFGRYSCRQFKSGRQQGQDAQVYLSVIDTEKHQANDGVSVILFCKVLTFADCGYTVKWLYKGNKSDIETSAHSCTAKAVFKTPHLYQKSVSDELLQCNVTVETSGQILLCPVRPQSSCEKPGSQLGRRNKTPSIKNPNPTAQGLPQWLWFVIAAVGLAALLIIFVAVIRCKKAKGNKTQTDENIGQSLNPAVTQSAPETSQDTADPEDVVSYASVSYIKKTDSKARACGKDNNDEGDTVTYSTLKASSSSAGDSADPSDLYATVNKPNEATE